MAMERGTESPIANKSALLSKIVSGNQTRLASHERRTQPGDRCQRVSEPHQENTMRCHSPGHQSVH